jgi:hypothetical protein
MLKLQLEHLRAAVMEPQFYDLDRRENTLVSAKLRRIVGMAAIKDGGGENVGRGPAVDDQMPTGTNPLME